MDNNDDDDYDNDEWVDDDGNDEWVDEWIIIILYI